MAHLGHILKMTRGTWKILGSDYLIACQLQDMSLTGIRLCHEEIEGMLPNIPAPSPADVHWHEIVLEATEVITGHHNSVVKFRYCCWSCT